MNSDINKELCETQYDKFDGINLEKCKNREDVILKLRELLMINDLDIKIDLEEKKAYLIIDGMYLLMRNISGNKFIVRYNNKMIGIELNELYGVFGIKVEISIIIIEGRNYQHYAYRQEYSDSIPWFFYNEYIDGNSHEFAANPNMAYFRSSNVPMRSTYEIAASWNHNLKGNHNRKINYTEIGFGVTIEQGTDEKILIPTVQSTIIRNNKGTLRKTTPSATQVHIGEYRKEYARKSKSENDDFLGFIETSDVLFNFENYAVYNIDDPKVMEYCIRVLQGRESKEEFEKERTRLETQPVYGYIYKYYGRLIEGIEYFQNLDVKDQTKSEKVKQYTLKLKD